jgi:tetratricopeptide (TPR) repeat protein
MASHDHTQPPSPQEEAAHAAEALQKGDLHDAVFHLGIALASDATHPEWRALLDQAIAATPDPRTLAPLSDGENHIVTVALHAYILAKLGRPADALEILLQVIVALPVHEESAFLPFLDWAIEWAALPEAAAKFPMARVIHLLGWMLEHYPGLILHREMERSVLQQLWLFLQRIPAAVPRDAQFHFGYSSLLRKLGWLPEALAAAEAGFQEHPCYQTAMALAMAHEVREDHEAWLANIRTALEFRPDDNNTRLTVADRLWNLDRKEDAAAWYEEVLEKEPEHPWAKPSLLAVQYELTRDKALLEQLQAYGAEHPDNERVGPLLQKFMPYIGFLPEPAEDTIRIFEEFFEKFAGPASDAEQIARISIPMLEAPSAGLVGTLQVNALGWPLEFRLEPAQIPKPDPRLPLGEVQYKLWNYWDKTPLPAVAEPSVEIAETIRDFAFTPYRLDAWLGRARQLASQLTREDLPSLLGVMVHPPDLPRGVPGWLWVQHVQIAAALTIAWLEEAEPWRESLRRQVLFDLAHGPMDWTVSAAIIALMGIAQVDAEQQEDTWRLFLELLGQLPEEGYVCHLHPLLCCALYLPVGSPQIREELLKWKEILEAREAV